jgi:hypothetical protein
MADSDPDVERLPPRVDNNDLDLLDDVYEALHTNSETEHLDNQDDVGRVYSIVDSLNGVRAIRIKFQVSA